MHFYSCWFAYMRGQICLPQDLFHRLSFRQFILQSNGTIRRNNRLKRTQDGLVRPHNNNIAQISTRNSKKKERIRRVATFKRARNKNRFRSPQDPSFQKRCEKFGLRESFLVTFRAFRRELETPNLNSGGHAKNEFFWACLRFINTDYTWKLSNKDIWFSRRSRQHICSPGCQPWE